MRTAAWLILPVILFGAIIAANVTLVVVASGDAVSPDAPAAVTEVAPAPAESPGASVTLLLGAVFTASLVGSLHCAGMCGGLVAMCVPLAGDTVRWPWVPHAAYHLGRLATYAALGAVSGAIGAAVDLGGSLVGLSRIAAIAAGATMIIVGLSALLRRGAGPFGPFRLPRGVDGAVRAGLRVAHRRGPASRGLLVGLLTGFLPCGWLYAFVITAAGSGSVAAGAAIMAVFWAGTVPVLLVLALGLQGLAGPLRRHVPTATAAALVIIGLVTVFGRLTLPAYAEAPVAVDAEARLERVRHLHEAPPACCLDHP